jgi:RNA polymerase sigma-70 factor (ECF subfamily)
MLAFLTAQVLPHEASLRSWLLKLGVRPDERDDVVQETYYRLFRMSHIDHIGDARAYFYRTARNVVLEQARRAKVVSIQTVQDLDDLGVAAHSPNPESETVARLELSHVLDLIASLPDRCRRIFEMRKIDGLSQAETARMMRVSENIVEKETARGLMFILDDLARSRPGSDTRAPRTDGRKVRHVGD